MWLSSYVDVTINKMHKIWEQSEPEVQITSKEFTRWYVINSHQITTIWQIIYECRFWVITENLICQV